MSRKHIPQLDGLRGFAVILVLLAHSTNPFTRLSLFTGWLDRYGSLGVQIFFVLSGFLITGILLDTRGDPHYFSSFFARRGLRIYPLYYAVFAFVVLSGVVHQHGVQWWVYALYLSNLFYENMMQPAPLAPTWSLAVEEQFYLVWPFVVGFLPRRYLQRLCLAIIAFAFILRLTGIFPLHNTLLQLDALAAGALLACRIDALQSLRAPAIFLAFLMPFGMGFGGNLILNSMSQTVQVLSAAGLLLVLLDNRTFVSRLFGVPVLRYVGTISYGVYLLHSFVFDALLRTRFFSNATESGSYAKAILCLAMEWTLALAVASASYFLFESPFLRMKRFFNSGKRRTGERRRKAGAETTSSEERAAFIGMVAEADEQRV